MKRRWKIALGLLAVLAVLLAVNTVTTDSQTKRPRSPPRAGRILELSRGDVQVTDSGEPAAAPGQPIVLLHCYACSLHWFDQIEPLLAERHRVIRIDLLGFGGSEKPESGYEIPTQAAVVAEAMNELDVQGALVAGNSMGAMVTASLAEQASQLVDRAVVIDMAPNTRDFGDGLPAPGAARRTCRCSARRMWRLTPDFAVRDAYKESFAPGFDVESGFDDPDQVLADFDAMTYTSFDDAHGAGRRLPRRAAARRAVQAGAGAAPRDLRRRGPDLRRGAGDRGVRRTSPASGPSSCEDAGHAPQVEQPDEVAALLDEFSVDLGSRAEPAAA